MLLHVNSLPSGQQLLPKFLSAWGRPAYMPIVRCQDFEAHMQERHT